jgi:hypothetical protein
MKVLALILALLSVPAFAADHSPWPGQGSGTLAGEQLAQGKGTQLCVPCTGCQETMCCCPSPQRPTCQNGTVTKLPNGNTACSMPQCSCP